MRVDWRLSQSTLLRSNHKTVETDGWDSVGDNRSASLKVNALEDLAHDGQVSVVCYQRKLSSILLKPPTTED